MGENVQSLNPSEAVCGFAAWLTTRDEVTTMSARHSSGPIADLVKEFCAVQGLPAISKSWPGNLVSQYSPASEEPGDGIGKFRVRDGERLDEYLDRVRPRVGAHNEKKASQYSPAAEEPEEAVPAADGDEVEGTWSLVDQKTKIETRLPKWAEKKADMINHPPHYTSHPSGVECIQVTEHMNFCLGNAVKYIWRADLKGSGVEDLKKAAWYIEREIKRRESK